MSPLILWPLWLRLGLAAGLGAVASFGLAPHGIWGATALALVALPLLLNAATGIAGAALAGWAFGAGYFGLGLSWIVEPFLVDAARDGWMAPFALVLMAGGLALFWGAAFGAAAALARPGGLRVLALVLTWSLAEVVRTHVFTGFPWAAPGQVWIDTHLAALLAWIGPQGLNLVTFLALLPLGMVLLPRTPPARLPACLVPVLALIGLALVAARAQPQVVATGALVRIVQPNVPQDQKWDAEYIPQYFGRQIDFTAALPRPALVVWPETAVPALLENAGPAFDVIAAAAGGAQVATGIERADAAGRYYNALVRLDGAGQVAAVYDKHHLVPFGEYFPLIGLSRRLGLRGLAERFAGGFSAGPGPQLMDFGPLGLAVPLICYEAVFARDAGGVPQRASFLLQVTNDAWFGERSGPYQHLAQARMRAIEQGLPLVRSANTGISAMIDPAGGVVDSLALGRTGYVDALLPAPFAPTLYARTGDTWVVGLLVVLLLAFGGYNAVTNRRIPD